MSDTYTWYSVEELIEARPEGRYMSEQEKAELQEYVFKQGQWLAAQVLNLHGDVPTPRKWWQFWR